MTGNVAYYIRTSTGRQDGEAQRHALREALRAREPGVGVDEYEDIGHTGKHTRRPALSRLMTDARAGGVRKLYFYALSRLGRSVIDTIRILEDLTAVGVELVCLRDPVDTSTPTGRAFVGMAAVFAQLEREFIQERTAAGLAARKARGWKLGRPRKPVDASTLQWASALIRDGHSLRSAAVIVDVPRERLRRALAADQKSPASEGPSGASNRSIPHSPTPPDA